MTDVDVIIVSDARDKSFQDITEQALSSLIASESLDEIVFHPVVIESAKRLEAENYAYIEAESTLYPQEPFNYNRFLNIGYKATSSPYIVFCNNDLLFKPKWASLIVTFMEALPDLASASPMCGITGEHRGFTRRFQPQRIMYGYQVRLHICGWCIFSRRVTIDAIGGFNENYPFWYADNSYSEDLRRHRLKHALVLGSRVDHLGSKTLSSLDQASYSRMTFMERDKFAKEYGLVRTEFQEHIDKYNANNPG